MSTPDAAVLDEPAPPTAPPPRKRTLFAALIGVITALTTFAVASLVSLLLSAENPFIAVGSAAIDFAPPGFKSLVISLFGTGDKAFLFILVAIVAVIAAIAAGILQMRKPPFGVIVLLFVGLVAALATVSRSGASPLDVIPTAVGVIAGWVMLGALVRRLDGWNSVEARLVPDAPEAGRIARQVRIERRAFLRLTIIGGAASLLVATGTGLSAAASNAAAVARAMIKLPRAASPAPAIPADAELHIPGLSPYIVPNDQFYRIDTALAVPNVNQDTWKLKVTGMVENEVEVTFAELLALPLEERIITLTCVSQEVGGNLIGNATWLGYPIRHVLARAKPTAGADMVLSRSIDGFTASTPLSVLEDSTVDSLLAIGMNGKPLPPEHGFPVRMVVPGLYGYVSATKWVVELKVTTYEKDQAYWTPRGYSAKGPIKLSSRIDTPQDGHRAKAGTIAIAGVAWHQHVGIAKVEVRIDDGEWQQAKLARVVTVDSWLQWSYAWNATAGNHTITVRAIDDHGQVQTSRVQDVVPNGATGLDSIQVSID